MCEVESEMISLFNSLPKIPEISFEGTRSCPLVSSIMKNSIPNDARAVSAVTFLQKLIGSSPFVSKEHASGLVSFCTHVIHSTNVVSAFVTLNIEFWNKSALTEIYNQNHLSIRIQRPPQKM